MQSRLEAETEKKYWDILCHAQQGKGARDHHAWVSKNSHSSKHNICILNIHIKDELNHQEIKCDICIIQYEQNDDQKTCTTSCSLLHHNISL